jgi:ABC-type nitrate/sulfonate/bicarbonate transport system substrate-binding protein
MNSCPYYMIASPSIAGVGALRGKTIACREAPSRATPLDSTVEQLAGLKVGHDITLQLTGSDEQAFNLAANRVVAAAIVPRPFGFWAEEKGFRRISEWPAVVDDPLPITIETTDRLLREHAGAFAKFLEAHRESIRYLKSHRDDALKMLAAKFGHSPSFAAKTFHEYFPCLDEGLKVDLKKLEQLVAQVNPESAVDVRTIADEWVVKGAVAP